MTKNRWDFIHCFRASDESRRFQHQTAISAFHSFALREFQTWLNANAPESSLQVLSDQEISAVVLSLYCLGFDDGGVKAFFRDGYDMGRWTCSAPDVERIVSFKAFRKKADAALKELQAAHQFDPAVRGDCHLQASLDLA